MSDPFWVPLQAVILRREWAEPERAVCTDFAIGVATGSPFVSRKIYGHQVRKIIMWDKDMVPEYLRGVLSDEDFALNQSPPTALLQAYEDQELQLFVDRGRAMAAARSGLPTSNLTLIFTIAFPALTFAAMIALFLAPWSVVGLLIIGAIVSFKAARHFNVEDVRTFAVRDERSLEVMMKNGAVWFEKA